MKKSEQKSNSATPVKKIAVSFDDNPQSTWDEKKGLVKNPNERMKEVLRDVLIRRKVFHPGACLCLACDYLPSVERKIAQEGWSMDQFKERAANNGFWTQPVPDISNDDAETYFEFLRQASGRNRVSAIIENRDKGELCEDANIAYVENPFLQASFKHLCTKWEDGNKGENLISFSEFLGWAHKQKVMDNGKPAKFPLFWRDWGIEEGIIIPKHNDKDGSGVLGRKRKGMIKAIKLMATELTKTEYEDSPLVKAGIASKEVIDAIAKRAGMSIEPDIDGNHKIDNWLKGKDDRQLCQLYLAGVQVLLEGNTFTDKNDGNPLYESKCDLLGEGAPPTNLANATQKISQGTLYDYLKVAESNT